MSWCQEGSEAATSLQKKTSGTDWYSAEGPGTGQLRTEVKSSSLMNPLSDRLGQQKLVRRRKGECHQSDLCHANSKAS